MTPLRLDYFSEAEWAAFGKRFDEIMNGKPKGAEALSFLGMGKP